MRWIFIIMLLLNLAYFGWELDRQVRIDRENAGPPAISTAGVQTLKLISESDVEPVTYTPVSAEDGPGITAGAATDTLFALPDNGLVTELPDFTIAGINDTGRGEFCYTFGPIEEEVLATGVEDWFTSRRAQTYMRYTDETGQLFWIYLAPSQDNNDAMSIIRDLQDQGINDYRVVSSGNLGNAISLGLYSGQSAVNQRLGELEQKGYKPVVVPYREGKRIYWIDVRLSMDPGALETVFQGYPARYNYVPVDCARLPR